MNAIKLDHETLFPSKVVCIGRNYAEHIAELNNELPEEPVIFIKPNSSISDELRSASAEALHYEGELTFLVRNGDVHGVGFGLDLTKRETQTRLKQKGLPWERAKAFNGSAVFSPFTRFEGDITELRLELHINGQLAQSGGYDLMLLKPDQILREIETFLTLEDGDLVMTGTPKGVGTFDRDDLFVGKVFEGERLLLEQSWLAS